MSDDHSNILWRDQAVRLVIQRREEALASQPVEEVTLDSISGRSLATSVRAETDLPRHDHATMDGFAFDATESYPLSLREESQLPEDEPGSIRPGEAVRIATGAPLPEGTNAVLKQEEATVEDGLLRGEPLEPGTYTYQRGSNVAAGEQLFETAECLSPKDAILLRDLGRESVPVHERFSTAILATGSEIHEGKTADLDSPMLAGLVESWGHEATYEGTVPDEYDRVEGAIDDLASQYDVIVTTGGTSVGPKDYVIRALRSLGEVIFHRVRLRPGKPLALAVLPDHDAVAFAVPGKPIGAHTISTLVAGPFFHGERALPTVEASMARPIDLGPEGFEYVIPVVFEETAEGRQALPLGHRDSQLPTYGDTFDPSVLSSSSRASRAEGVVITQTPLDRDETVRVVSYPSLE